MSVNAIKLTTSEELIGEVVEETEDFISLKNVVTVAIQNMPDGRTGIGFLPFMPYAFANRNVKLSKKFVLISEPVEDQMANQYNSVFGGIVVPPKTLITG